MVSCIGGHRPDREEFRIVARRIWNETHLHHVAADACASEFGAKRVLVRATRSALFGTLGQE
jgi:hypothetical protein